MTVTEKERERRARHRLAIIHHAQEVTRNVSKTCRYYGITRTAYYKWLRRYEAGDLEALKRRVIATTPQPPDDAGRGGGQDRLPAQHLPLRAAQDRDVPRSLSRHHDQSLGHLAHPQASRHEPAAHVPALPSPQGSLEALREARARFARPGRREVHRTAARHSQEALPVHRHRRLHASPRPARLRSGQPDDGHPFRRRGPL
jgi:transposase-like protein